VTAKARHKSFVARTTGTFDTTTGLVVMDGRVTDGWHEGASVHEEGESEEKSNERKGAEEMRRLKTSRRFAGLIAVLVLAAGVTAASAQTENRRGHGKRAGLELTYTKWFAPGFPNMVGVVGGDIVGQFGGAVLRATPDDSGRFVRLTAIYIVVAPDPPRSLTIRVEGAQDIQSGTAVLNGRVVDGSLTGARAHAEFKVISCTQSPDGMCFEGTISIKQRDDDEDDDD
jgi:hypothetical protein